MIPSDWRIVIRGKGAKVFEAFFVKPRTVSEVCLFGLQKGTVIRYKKRFEKLGYIKNKKSIPTKWVGTINPFLDFLETNHIKISKKLVDFLENSLKNELQRSLIFKFKHPLYNKEKTNFILGFLEFVNYLGDKGKINNKEIEEIRDVLHRLLLLGEPESIIVTPKRVSKTAPRKYRNMFAVKMIFKKDLDNLLIEWRVYQNYLKNNIKLLTP